MKRQKIKLRKISRIKHPEEQEIDIEHQKQVNALTTQFKEDKLKAVLRRCYSDVKKYGTEAIVKAVEDSWTSSMVVGCSGVSHDSTNRQTFIQIEDDVSKNHMDANLEVEAYQAYSTSHDHEETSKQNALFLIESSENLPDYNSDTLIEMKQAYKKDRYDDVVDLAYLQDRSRRHTHKSRTNNKSTLRGNSPESPLQRVSELLTEVAEENQESPLKSCVEAVRYLSRDLTYDNIGAAKKYIRKAIKYLEDN